MDDVVERLRAAGCVAAEDEARELVTAAGGAVPEDWLRRRERGEPLAWITGRTEFCGHVLHVDPGVYVPRPQTEELARRAAAALPAHGRAADLCTGSGAIAVHLLAEVPTAEVLAADIDPLAVACARRNGVNAIDCDLAAELGDPGSFDVVTSVPPYVPTSEIAFLPPDIQRYEPRAALDGGDDGLDAARRVISAAARLLRPGGRLFIELGGDQDERLEVEGFASAESWRNEYGELRGLAVQMRTR